MLSKRLPGSSSGCWIGAQAFPRVLVRLQLSLSPSLVVSRHPVRWISKKSTRPGVSRRIHPLSEKESAKMTLNDPSLASSAKDAKVKSTKKSAKETIVNEGNTTASAAHSPRATPSSSDFQQRLIRLLTFTRYRASGFTYNRDHAYALAQRLTVAGALLFCLFAWDQTCWITPFYPIRPLGPSMLPTIAVDGEVWLVASPWIVRLWRWRRLLFGGATSMYRKGDLVGFSPPYDFYTVGLKRVIGVSGETVASCGQYVKLYLKQDPINLGRPWPEDQEHPMHETIRMRYLKEVEERANQPSGHPYYLTTEVVPERELWVESDCPGMGFDSRQHGSIPEAWVRGIVVGRIWPLRRLDRPKGLRPHPIPLDDATLKRYHIHRVKSKTTTAEKAVGLQQ